MFPKYRKTILSRIIVVLLKLAFQTSKNGILILFYLEKDFYSKREKIFSTYKVSYTFIHYRLTLLFSCRNSRWYNLVLKKD